MPHRPTQTQYDEPLAAPGALSRSAWALPAVMLSWASLIVFFVVLAFLQINVEMRTFFVLPFEASWIAVPTAILAWVVAVSCSGRPGRNFPRFWVLGLALLTTAIAALGGVTLWDPQFLPVSARHALAVAGLAAVLVLLPRLKKVRPSSRLVQHLAPLSLLLVLLLVLPTAYLVGQKVVHSHGERVTERIQRLERWTAEVRAVVGHDFSAGTVEAGKTQIRKLEDLNFKNAMQGPGLWESAAALQRETDLSQSYLALVKAVVAGMTQAPGGSERRPSSAQAATGNPVIEDYYQQLGRLFLELETQSEATASNPIGALAPELALDREKIEAHLATLANSWLDSWILQQLPESLLAEELRQQPLAVQLGLSMTSGPTGEMPAAGALSQLLGLNYNRARALVDRTPNCQVINNLRRQEHLGYESRSIECQSMESQHGGAENRIVVNLRYKSDQYKLLSEQNPRPESVIYRFAKPKAMASEAFLDEVTQSLATAFERFDIIGFNGSTGYLQIGASSVPYALQGGDSDSLELEVTPGIGADQSPS